MTTRAVVISATIIAGVALLPKLAVAQSVIAGQVRDDSGGVLPGTTVEASSPVLIEGKRTVVTDDQGRYSIVNLRPGLYTVTFTLAGFNTVINEGLELPADFTATVNTTMKVGGLAETLTVSGQSPTVDVQQTQRSQVLTREVLDSVPTSRSIWGQAVLATGVNLNVPDVGGTRSIASTNLSAHGASAAHQTVQVDGMMVNTILSNGINLGYFQDSQNQEVSVESGGGSAEVSSGGVRVNMIPRDGGNTFSGSLFLGGSDGSWQSDNFSQRLKDYGLRAISRVSKTWDFNPAQGGPLLKDRLWFFGSMRHWGVNQPVADTFLGNVCGPTGCVIGGDQGILDTHLYAFLLRLTSQSTPRNKVSAYLDRTFKYIGHTGLTAGTDPLTATALHDSNNPYYTGQAKWTSTVSNRLLLEAGFSAIRVVNHNEPQAGVAALFGTPEWYARARKVDLNLGTVWNGVAESWGWASRYVLATSASYVTGSHSLKVGIQDTYGYRQSANEQNGALTQQFRSGVADSVIVSNVPVALSNRLNYDLGIYAQDRWTIDRLTVSGGVRFEWLNSQANATTASAGRFVGPREFPARENVPDWFDVSPRLGLAYDLFGNGKTAVKFNVGKYVTPHTVGFAEQFNPMALVSTTLPWSDRDRQGRSLPTNGDGIAQDGELDLTRLPTNFGLRRLGTFDPDLKREYHVQTNVLVQHELLRNVSVSAGWFRTAFHNPYLTYNQNWTFDDYVPLQIVSPYNGELITVYSLKSAALLSRVDNITTNSKKNSSVYNGFDVSTEARLGGATIFGGATIQRTVPNLCDTPDNPNNQRFCDFGNLPAQYGSVPFRTDYKISGSYPFPGGVQVSGTFQSYAGAGEPINFLVSQGTRYTAANCAGRPCTPGALVIPGMVQTSLTVPLAPSLLDAVVGQINSGGISTDRFLPRLYQLDFSARKRFRAFGIEWQPEVSVFNVLNVDTWFRERSGNFGTSAYAVPSDVHQGRIPRVGLQMKW